MTGTVDVDYLGLNHLGWLRSVRVDGTDVLPGLIADAVTAWPGSRRAGCSGRTCSPRWARCPTSTCTGTTRASRRSGPSSQPGARAASTYASASTRSTPPPARTLRAPPSCGTQANDERNRSYLSELRTDEREEADVAVGGYESVAIALAEALTGRAGARLVLNVANGSTVAALPPSAVIETVCDVDSSGAHPRPTTAPNAHELGLMATVKACEQRRDRRGSHPVAATVAMRAFATHPLVGSPAAARELAVKALARAS